MTDLITAGEAARLLGVPVNTFRQWVKRGKVEPAQKIHGRLWLYRRTDIDAMAPSKEGHPSGIRGLSGTPRQDTTPPGRGRGDTRHDS